MPLFTAPNRLETQRWQKKRIGIFGGSFNPPHAGHVHVAKSAMAALQLDFIWWLITPQNPLKDQTSTPINERIQACQAMISDPKMIVTRLEKDLNGAHSYETIKKIKKNFPTTQFVWITGLDNAHTLHHWHHWQDLLREVPFLHITRPPAETMIKNCPLRLNSKQKHLQISKSAPYPLLPMHTYWMMNRKLMHISSTEIRDKHGK